MTNTSENIVEEMERLKKQSEEYLNGWKRAKADYLNLKKDMDAQSREIKEWMSKIFILPLLEIADNFNKAFNNAPESIKTNPWVSGIESIEKQLDDYLKASGVEAMSSVGEKFDPLRHEAVESINLPDNGEKSGQVAEEVQKGYLIKGEVLRPAKVKVYK